MSRVVHVTARLTRRINVMVEISDQDMREGGMGHVADKIEAAINADANRPVKPWDYETADINMTWRDV